MFFSAYERELARETIQRRIRLGMIGKPRLLEPPRDPYTSPEIPEDEPEPDELEEPELMPPPPEPPPPMPLNAARIRNVVTDHSGMTREQVWGENGSRRSRRNKYVRVRFMAFMLCRELLHDYSLPKIGRRLGGFDHTTILHGLRRARVLMETDEGFAAAVEAARVRLGVTGQPSGEDTNVV